ncbi:MAG TPA: hypothetical protein PLZ75_10365 [Bacteroidales bacterium]|jgi:hypothetical protein|nr:hypothetical protein [Bacteroidales bacterium]
MKDPEKQQEYFPAGGKPYGIRKKGNPENNRKNLLTSGKDGKSF